MVVKRRWNSAKDFGQISYEIAFLPSEDGTQQYYELPKEWTIVRWSHRLDGKVEEQKSVQAYKVYMSHKSCWSLTTKDQVVLLQKETFKGHTGVRKSNSYWKSMGPGQLLFPLLKIPIVKCRFEGVPAHRAEFHSNHWGMALWSVIQRSNVSTAFKIRLNCLLSMLTSL